MKRSDLISLLGIDDPQLASREAMQIVDLVFDRIADTLARGARVELRGFGSFSTRSIKARTSRNPLTGTPVHVVKRRHPHFKPSSTLAMRVRGLA